MKTGYDITEPYDAYYSLAAGVTWLPNTVREWARIVQKGQTVGDLPVSGTVNNIEIPHSSSVSLLNQVTLSTDAETTLADISLHHPFHI